MKISIQIKTVYDGTEMCRLFVCEMHHVMIQYKDIVGYYVFLEAMNEFG